MQFTSPTPPSKATVASAGDMVTVAVSNFAYSSIPYSFAAAICNAIAGDDTRSEGTGIFLHLPRSASVTIPGSLLVIMKGSVTRAPIARTSCLVPRVFAHRVNIPCGLPPTMSTVSDNSASFIAAGPLKRNAVTFTSGMPSAAACF